MEKRRAKPRSQTKPAHEDLRRDAPAFAAYIVVIIRLLAFLTVQLHLDPSQPPPAAKAAINRVEPARDASAFSPLGPER